jgi:hypothetical protein
MPGSSKSGGMLGDGLPGDGLVLPWRGNGSIVGILIGVLDGGICGMPGIKQSVIPGYRPRNEPTLEAPPLVGGVVL